MYEISSDSDEEWYDKCPKKLERLRNKYGVTNNLHVMSVEDNQIESNDDNFLNSDTTEVFDDGSTNLISNELDLSTPTRRSKRKNGKRQLSPVTPIEKGAKRGRGRGRDRGRGRGSQSSIPPAPKPRGRGRGRGSQSSTPPAPKPRGRGRRGRNSEADPDYDLTTENIPAPSPRRGGRGRRRGTQRNTRNVQSIVTYSVGNTHEYPDASDDQVLFSNKKISEPTTIVDLDEALDNEELSVKVIWQHVDVVRFNIRKHQKLTQMFDFFVNGKGVDQDRLLFTYNQGTRDRVLRPDDTPESINYNIAKFIEGGIIKRQMNLIKNDTPEKKGFIIKFQCQNKKKPLEVSVGKDEKLQLAMVKCAEHLEVPVFNLLFEFDGEMIHGTTTPNALDMDSGDCIDVKIINVNK